MGEPHADLYRLDSATELPHIGLSDYEDGRTVTAIEWADKAGHDLPADRLEIHLQHRSPSIREITFVPRGTQARRLLARMRAGQLSSRTAGQRRRTR